MKFAVKDLQSQSYEGMRVYTVSDGVHYPSITTVLGATIPEDKRASLEGWRKSVGDTEADRISLEATTFGTAVHEVVEKYLNTGIPPVEQDGYSRDHIAAFNVLKPKLKSITEVWVQEAALFSHRLAVAGRCDCIGIYKGVPTIIDFKTSSRLKQAHQIQDYFLQLAAYAVMFNEMHSTDISRGTILMVSDRAFPQEFNVDLRDYTGALELRVHQFYERFLTQQ